METSAWAADSAEAETGITEDDKSRIEAPRDGTPVAAGNRARFEALLSEIAAAKQTIWGWPENSIRREIMAGFPLIQGAAP